VTDDLSNSQNVIAVSFEENSKAYKAMTLLKQLDSQDQVDLSGAAVVERHDDGHVEVKDQVADEPLYGTVGGGVVGLIIGIIGGPLGVLIGGATGVLVGSLFDVGDADSTESALSAISQSVANGRTALLAEVAEQSTEVVDEAMRGLGGEVLRRSVADVKAEIAAAEKAQRKAKREARHELNKARREHDEHEIQAKIAELKSKLHKAAPATTP
jgi:uncharacterized membrane protein